MTKIASTWVTHLSLRSTDYLPKSGDMEAACGKLVPNAVPMFGEDHESLRTCKTCKAMCDREMPTRSERKYFTFLIPGERLKVGEVSE